MSEVPTAAVKTDDPVKMAIILRSGFDVIAQYTRLQNREAWLMCGWLGYTLHNLPYILRAHLNQVAGREPFWLYHSSRGGAVSYVSPDFAPVFDSVFVLETTESTRPICLPPPETLEKLTHRLFDVTQSARGLWNYYTPIRQDRNGIPYAVTDEERENLDYCGLLAELHRDLPEALLNWQDFDGESFREQYELKSLRVPYTVRDYHLRYFPFPVY